MTERAKLRFHGGDRASGGVFVIETRAEAGTMLESHKHEHGHVSVLVEGIADVTIDGQLARMTGYSIVNIPPGCRHSIVAVTDVIWLCLWSTDNVDREQVLDTVRVVEALNNG